LSSNDCAPSPTEPKKLLAAKFYLRISWARQLLFDISPKTHSDCVAKRLAQSSANSEHKSHIQWFFGRLDMPSIQDVDWIFIPCVEKTSQKATSRSEMDLRTLNVVPQACGPFP
jgi:hypothetical protein